MINVLYVEDEPSLAKIVKETLEGQGYGVTLIKDGKNAIAAFDPKIVDICVLDIMLPNKNGFDIATEIKAIQNNIPIIFLTAKNQTEDVLKGFDSGGNDYIKKPFSMDELIARIDNLLKIAGANIKEKKLKDIPIGTNSIFSPQNMVLQIKGKKKILSHRESQILELLCSNKNSTTSRKSILMEVWGDDSFYNSRNLDVYIAKLRTYLKKEENAKILTLKGVGYLFVLENES